jgi:hypothetical protein
MIRCDAYEDTRQSAIPADLPSVSASSSRSILWFDPRREHSSCPDRQIWQPPRAGGVKAGRHSARKAPSAFPGRALTAPSTAASCIGRDRKAPHLSHGAGLANSPHQPRQQNPAPHKQHEPARNRARSPCREGLRQPVLVEAEAQKQRGDPKGPLLMEKAGGLERPIVGILGRCAELKGIGLLAVLLVVQAARRSETRSGRPSDV